MKVKRWKLAAFLLPCLLLFALIYLIPLGMVFGSSFFEWKAGGVLNFVGLVDAGEIARDNIYVFFCLCFGYKSCGVNTFYDCVDVV